MNLITMSLLALALPDVERTTVATLDSFEDVADIFERNLPDQVRHSAPVKLDWLCVWLVSSSKRPEVVNRSTHAPDRGCVI